MQAGLRAAQAGAERGILESTHQEAQAGRSRRFEVGEVRTGMMPEMLRGATWSPAGRAFSLCQGPSGRRLDRQMLFVSVSMHRYLQSQHPWA